MNKTLKLALGAVLAVGIIMPAFAQTDNFPDVPDNHWAYEALARLKKDGLLVGYPDGLFRGNRPASRYELAVAIHATYVHLKSITDGLQAEIDALKNTQPQDIQPLKDAIAQLQDEVNNMKGWGADIDNLKKLADQFQKELASLGVDVEGLKRDLADLAKRVGVLEAHRLPFDIHGELDMFMVAGASNSHEPGITVDGRPVGVRIPYSNGKYDTAGMDVDSTIYHELDLSLKSNNDTGPKWHGDIVVGNMISGSATGINSLFSTGANTGGGFSMSRTGTGPFSTGAETVYVQDLAVDFDTSIVGQGLAAELGRTGYSIDPYIFQRPDTNPYFQNDRWSNGKWYFDGGILGFHFGGVRLDAFGGKTDDLVTTTGISYQQLSVGSVGHINSTNPNGLMSGVLPINEDLGLNLKVPLGQNGKLDLAYVWFESNNGVGPGGSTPVQSAPNGASNVVANRADVYGGDLKWNFGSIVFDGGYSASELKLGNSNLTNKDNYAWHGQLAYDTQRWGAQVGYRQIMPQFGAPGDWGRIGSWWNPTDIQGPEANIHLNLSQTVKLSVAGEWDEGTGTNFNLPASLGGGPSTGLSHSDTIGHYTAELGFRLNDAWNLTLGTELVYWHLPVAGAPASNPTQQWYNVGLGYNLSDQARLSFLYQYSNWDSKGNTAFQPFANNFTGAKYSGSLLTTQLSVKF
ncbi:MAG TPA: S-layer homology domain-containing protein [Fimbriimonadaceae bacterium]|jgi:hypothetical protein